MKKILFIWIILISFKLSLFEHSCNCKVEFHKTLQPVAIIEWPYSEGVVENALKDYMGKGGFKETNLNGFHVFKSAKLDSSESELSDLYFKIEPKAERKKTLRLFHYFH